MSAILTCLKNWLHRPGIEPGPPAWQASILPLNQRCSLANSGKHNWVITMMEISWDWKKDSRSVGFEPTPAERNWFLVSRLNHSATTAGLEGMATSLLDIELFDNKLAWLLWQGRVVDVTQICPVMFQEESKLYFYIIRTNCNKRIITARLAQSVEHETLNLRVVGSLGEHFTRMNHWKTFW